MHFSSLAARALALMVLCAGMPMAHGHKASDAYLDLQQEGSTIAVRWDIAFRDLDQLLDLDTDGSGTLTWGEVQRQQPVIRDFALGAIELTTAAGTCRSDAVTQQVARREDGAYAVLRWRATCPDPVPEIAIQYRLLLDVDPTHRLILSAPGSGVALRTLRPSAEFQRVVLNPGQGSANGHDIAGFFVEGFRHILYGFDHLAFLLALLIPAIAAAGAGGQPLRVTLGRLLMVVSAFTLAHSITLGLSALNLISLPSRLVESLVALSVVVAGLQALLAGKVSADPRRPSTGCRSLRFGEASLWLVFGFGLIHGIGFGAALEGAELGGRTVFTALLGFNLGVEAGQLAVMAVVLPLAWALKSGAGFRRVLLPGAAMTIVVAGVLWFMARAFNLHIADRLLS